MSQEETRDLLQLLEEEKRLRQEAERRQHEAERRQKEAEEENEETKRMIRPTTLPEFLDACHTHLFRGLTVASSNISTTGKLDNAENKLRPDKIREWVEFPEEQAAIWKDLMDVDFVMGRHFATLHSLQQDGKKVRERMMSSELDLGYFERYTVQDHVSSVVKELSHNQSLRTKFKLEGRVAFENHGNSITGGAVSQPDEESSQENPRPSKLQKKSNEEPSTAISADKKPPLPRADQFCVYNKGRSKTIPAFIVEYKAPHKLTLGHIKVGLHEMEIDVVLREKKKESTEDICRYLVAAVITQAFSYMIASGVLYGYVCTGEAFIFLRVMPEDPSTVYYYLSVPNEDVGETTGWTGDVYSDNKLHLTAIGQVLAFTLRTLRTSPLSANWRTRAAENLERWEMSYDVIWDQTPVKVIPAGAHGALRRSARLYALKSPIQKPASSRSTCYPPQDLTRASDDEDYDEDDNHEGGFDPNSPSRKPKSSNRVAIMPPPAPKWAKEFTGKDGFRSYCTHKCLLGLIRQGPLDKNCPNVKDHGVSRHQINQSTFINLLRRQVLRKNLDRDTTLGCEPMYYHGRRGSLFKVELMPYGYTVAGKGMRTEFFKILLHEQSIYERLKSIQGAYIPVCLGHLDISSRPIHGGFAFVSHILLLSHAGMSAVDTKFDDCRISQLSARPKKAISELGVLHCDLHMNNMFWNEENNSLMIIDFERARTCNPPPLGPISPNKKRKRADFTPIKLSEQTIIT